MSPRWVRRTLDNVPSDDELRRVAEDVRALARSLARDIRAAVDRARDDVHGPATGDRTAERLSAREDLAEAGRVARDEWRRAQQALRRSARSHPHQHPADAGDGVDGDERAPYPWGPGPYGPPRWDNRAGRRHRDRHPYPPTDDTASGLGPAPLLPSGLSQGGVALRDRPTARALKPARMPKPDPLPLRHRHDGSTLIGLLAVVFGLAWLAAGTHVAHVSSKAVVAVALMVLGAVMVVTARTDWALSRKKWPILAGALLALALLFVSVSHTLPVGFRHPSIGSRVIAPTSWDQVPTVIHGGFGRTLVNLASISGPLATPRTLSIDSAAGRLVIVVPENVNVALEANVTAGQITVNGDTRTAGVGRSDVETLDPTASGAVLTLRVDAGLGSVEISQATAPGSSVAATGTPTSAASTTVPAAPAVPSP